MQGCDTVVNLQVQPPLANVRGRCVMVCLLCSTMQIPREALYNDSVAYFVAHEVFFYLSIRDGGFHHAEIGHSNRPITHAAAC